MPAGDEERGLPSTRRDEGRAAEGARFVASCMPPSVTERPASRYEEGEALGRGGMGKVFAVTDTELGRSVVKKQLHAHLESHPDAVLRFVEEAQLTAMLEHPNIVPVHELGLDVEGRPYFTMKRVEGRTLAAILALDQRDGGGLDRRLRVFLSICNAVGYAHSRGVVHRDLKPENVMVGEFGQVMVMDWGLAKTSVTGDDSALPDDHGKRLAELFATSARPDTPHGQVVGTPGYMAPEQASGQPSCDPRVDVYSLGAILFEMLALRPAFDGDSIGEVLIAALDGELPQAGSAPEDPHVPRELAAIAAKAMEPAPADRYGSVPALVEDVEAYLAGFSVSALRDPPWRRARKWLRRHPAAAVALVAALATLVGTVWWMRSAERVEREQRVAGLVAQADARLREANATLGAPGARAELERLRAALVERPLDAPRGAGARWESTTAALLAASSALDRALQIAPGDAALRARRRRVGEALVLAALLSGDESLAAAMAGELPELGVSARRAEVLASEVERRRSGGLKARLARTAAVLARFDSGPVEVDEAVVELLTYRDPEVGRQLSSRLRALAARAASDATTGRATGWSDAERGRVGLLTRVLARRDEPEALAALDAFARAVRDPQLSIAVGRALCRTGREAALFPLASLLARMGRDEPSWRPIAAQLGQLPALTDAALRGRPRGTAQQLAELELARGRARRAVEICDGLIAADARLGPALATRGRALVALGEARRALPDFAVALDHVGGRREIARVLLGRARAHVALGLRREALKDYARALREQPELHVARVLRAKLLRRMGQHRQALADLEAVLRAVRDHPDALFERGMVRLVSGDTQGALFDFDRLQAIEPRSARAAVGRGRVAQLHARHDAAIAAFDLAIRTDPTLAEAWGGRGITHNRIGKTKEAARDLRRACELAPSWSDAHYNYAIVLVTLGRPVPAIAHYGKAIEAEPGHARAMVNRGILRRDRLGQHDAAIADFEQAIAVNAKRWEAYVNLGVTLVLHRQDGRGIAQIERGLEVAPRQAKPKVRGILRDMRAKLSRRDREQR